uniref:CUE domain-containing protein n=1 Tax=Kalanchoe fedtschenkoi TaxID=63787 RepID=A0A7N0TBL7_KALFE
MSAIVCGKRSFFEDLPTPTPVSKRIRCSSSSSSPVRLSPPRISGNSHRSSAVERLVAAFPGMDKQLIERVLDECGDDLDSAIRSLNELCLGSYGELNGKPESNSQHEAQNVAAADAGGNGESGLLEGQTAQNNTAMDGAQWVELFVSEMKCASNMDDARARASRALEALEKSIVTCAGAEAVQSFEQENTLLKGQIQALVQENSILKRAVGIQHERQKDYEDKIRELQNLKQMVSQYQEQLHTLEVNNYALAMHLKQAQQNSSISGRFNPDVF